VHPAADAWVEATQPGAVLSAQATPVGRGIDGGASTSFSRLTDGGALGERMLDIVQSVREGEAHGTSSVHTIKAYAEAARLATSRRPHAETLSDRWDRWLLDWMVWSEKHKVTFNLTPGLNSTRGGARPELGRRHTAGPRSFRAA
jgi:hypothetical protein